MDGECKYYISLDIFLYISGEISSVGYSEQVPILAMIYLVKDTSNWKLLLIRPFPVLGSRTLLVRLCFVFSLSLSLSLSHSLSHTHTQFSDVNECIEQGSIQTNEEDLVCFILKSKINFSYFIHEMNFGK